MTDYERPPTTEMADPLPLLTRIDQHSKTLDRAVRLTQMADAKTAPVLALQATLAAVTVTQAGSLASLLDPDRNPGLVGLAVLLLLSYIAVAVASAVLGIVVFVPRAPSMSRYSREADQPVSLVYFDDIRRMPAELFRERATAVTAGAFEDDLLIQVRAVSGVAAVKMAHVRRALQLTVLTFVFWLPLIAWAQA